MKKLKVVVIIIVLLLCIACVIAVVGSVQDEGIKLSNNKYEKFSTESDYVSEEEPMSVPETIIEESDNIEVTTYAPVTTEELVIKNNFDINSNMSTWAVMAVDDFIQKNSIKNGVVEAIGFEYKEEGDGCVIVNILYNNEEILYTYTPDMQE